MLFRREAYERIGGYEGVKGEIVDDMELGRKIISAGFEWRLLDGTRHVFCRMYRGFWEAVDGFSKSLFAVFDYRILPYLFAWTIVTVAFLEPVVALVSRCLGYPLTSLPADFAFGAVILSLALWMTAYKRFRFPPYLVFFYPLSMALFYMVAMRSLILTITGKASWKERTLERVGIRWL